MASTPDVLRVNTAEEQADYMEAVAEILRRIQAEHKGPDGKSPITLYEIAEKVDISITTVSAAANKKTVLNVMYLNRLGRKFGPHALDPYLALFGARGVPRQAGNGRDLLPVLNRAAYEIARDRDPDGPTKGRDTHCARFARLPTLLELSRELSAEIVEIEDERARLSQ